MPNDTDASKKTVQGGASATGQQPPNPNAEMTAEEFVKLIREGRAPDRNLRTVSGDVDLTGVRFPTVLSIREVTFTGQVNFSQARFKRGLGFIGCHFEKALILSDARVEGPLTLDDAVIGRGQAPVRDLAVIRQAIDLLECAISQTPRDSKDEATLNIVRRRQASLGRLWSAGRRGSEGSGTRRKTHGAGAA